MRTLLTAALVLLAAAGPASAGRQGPTVPEHSGGFRCECSPRDFSGATAVTVGSQGSIFTIALGGGPIRHSATGEFELTWSIPGPGLPADETGDVAATPSGDVIIPNGTQLRLIRYASNGSPMDTIGSAGSGPGQFEYPSGVVVAADGTIYAADLMLHRITKFDPAGQYLAHWSAAGDRRPFLDDSGHVYAISPLKRVYKYSQSGQLLLSWGGTGAGPGQFGTVFQSGGPTGGAQGSDGFLYLSDTHNHRVQVFNTMGEYQYEFGSQGDGPYLFGSLGKPAFDALGNLYIPDAVNQKVHKYGPGPVPVRKASWGLLKTRYR